MGYWGSHPMSGDNPADARNAVLDILELGDWDYEEGVTEDEKESLYQKYSLKVREELSKDEVLENLLSTGISQHHGQNCWGDDGKWWGVPFVLPFLILEFEVKLNNPELAKMVKEMIGDGGDSDRGYTDEEGPDRPLTYAKAFFDNFDDLTSGKMPFAAFKEFTDNYDKGLFHSINEKQKSGSSGLANVK